MHLIAVIEILAQIYFISHAIKTDKPRYWIIILLIPWVGFLVYFLSECVPELLQGQNADNSIDQTCDINQLEDHKLAYITQGKLFLKCDSLFYYLNFFSLVYSKKPLTTASGPKINGDDLKTIVLKGKIIDAEKALRNGARIMGVPSLVPSSWELIRRSENNSEEVVAKNVAAFDISSDGTIVYSNGYGVFKIDNQRRPKLILKDNVIEEVIVG